MSDTRDAVQSIAEILSPEPQEPPKEEKPAAEEEVQETPAEEVEAQETEEQPEADPDETVEEPEGEEAPSDEAEEKYVFEVDGEEREFTADELLDLVQTHDMTSAEKERLDQEREAFQREREQYQNQVNEAAQQAEQVRQQYLQQLDQLLKADEQQDPRPQYEDFDDFESYTIAKDAWEQRKEQRESLRVQQQQEMERQRQLQAHQWESHRANEAHLLKQKAPHLTEERIRENISWLKEFGFEPDQLDPFADHRYTWLLDYARKGYEAEKGKPKVLKKVAGKPKVQKPGSPPSKAEIQSEESAAKFKRLQKTGDVRDAASILLDRL